MALQGPIRRGHWNVTTYENLVLDPDEEMESILELIGEPMPPAMRRRLDKPSKSASEDLKTEDIDAQLTKWRRNLSTAQIDTILRVAHAFDLDFYTEAPVPNRKELMRAVEEARCKRSAVHSEV
jgi:hypothetical protein